MESTNYRSEDPFAIFSFQGGCFRKRGMGTVGRACFLTGMALAVVTVSMVALPIPSFAQTGSGTSAAAEPVTTTTTIDLASGATATAADKIPGIGLPFRTRPVNSRLVDTTTSTFDTTITVRGTVSGGRKNVGVYASRTGTGGLGIVNYANISGMEHGIQVAHQSTADLSIANYGRITNVNYGIHAIHSSEGLLSIRSNGTVNARKNGIYAWHKGTGDLDISVGGRGISSSSAGIYGFHTGSGDIDVRVLSGRNVTSTRGAGILVAHVGNILANINLKIHGRVSGRGWGATVHQRSHGRVAVDVYDGIEDGIVVNHDGLDIIGTYPNRGVVINVHPGAFVSAGGWGAIHVNSVRHSVIVDVAGSVSGRSGGGEAINIMGGYYSHLTLRPGFSLNGAAVVGLHELHTLHSDRPSIRILQLFPTLGSTGVLDLSAEEFRGFTDFGTAAYPGTWVVTGTADESEAFESASVQNRSTLRFSNAHFKMVGNTIINRFIMYCGSVLEVAGHSSLRGELRNYSKLAFVQEENADGSSTNRPITDGSLKITGNYSGRSGSSVGNSHALVFNVDLASQKANKLTIEGNIRSNISRDPGQVSMSVPTTSGMSGDSGASTPPEGERTSPVLIEVKGSALATDFEGSTDVGVHNYALDHERDAVSGAHKWRFKYKGPAAHVVMVEATETTLTELAAGQSPPSGSDDVRPGGLEFRDDVRKHAGGIWAQQQNFRASLEPGGIAGSRLRMENNRVRFGFDLPAAGLMGGDVVMGASVWQGLSTSDVSSSTGNGFVGVESHAATLTASWWFPGGFYADGQAQYARFSSDVSAKGLLLVRDNEGVGMSASAEAGYRFAAPFGGVDFRIVPQAQLIWSRVDFGDFSGPSGGLISLEDGDLMAGRLGLSWDGEWRDAGGSGHVYGGMSLSAALDGRTAVSVSGVSFANERKGLSADGRLGVSYEWDEGYAVYGEAVTSRRDDTEDVRVNLGAHIDF